MNLVVLKTKKKICTVRLGDDGIPFDLHKGENAEVTYRGMRFDFILVAANKKRALFDVKIDNVRVTNVPRKVGEKFVMTVNQ